VGLQKNPDLSDRGFSSFVGSLGASGAAPAACGGRTGSRLAFSISLLIPPAPLESKTGLGDELLHGTAAGAALSEWGIGKLLPGLEDQTTRVALIFIHGHEKTSNL
jgi:hypothetical protein